MDFSHLTSKELTEQVIQIISISDFTATKKGPVQIENVTHWHEVVERYMKIQGTGQEDSDSGTGDIMEQSEFNGKTPTTLSDTTAVIETEK